jgi:hypothetical protein
MLHSEHKRAESCKLSKCLTHRTEKSRMLECCTVNIIEQSLVNWAKCLTHRTEKSRMLECCTVNIIEKSLVHWAKCPTHRSEKSSMLHSEHNRAESCTMNRIAQCLTQCVESSRVYLVTRTEQDIVLLRVDSAHFCEQSSLIFMRGGELEHTCFIYRNKEISWIKTSTTLSPKLLRLSSSEAGPIAQLW